jgi:hypothetical protein
MVACAPARGAREKRVTGRSQRPRTSPRRLTIHLDMTTRVHIHQSPPEAVVAELVRAGISTETAMAMERWKAQEVLELLRFGQGSGSPHDSGKGRAGA